MAKVFPIVQRIKKSWLTIYDPVVWTDLWVDNHLLQEILTDALSGKMIWTLPNRTRSKVLKSCVCEALWYPIPASFKKDQPRFLGQGFDIYVQKSNNLQIWNEAVSNERRYAVIQMLEDGSIWKIKVLWWVELAKLDTTWKFTIKYQATYSTIGVELVRTDTDNLQEICLNTGHDVSWLGPVDKPSEKSLIPSPIILSLLQPIVWLSFPDVGLDQERNRAAELHKLVCEYLGYSSYKDNGQFPDVLNQLLEIKLQTSPTIDLGRTCPNSLEKLMEISSKVVFHEDVRYAIFYWSVKNGIIEITHLTVISGKYFFERFPQFKWKVVNKKIQLPLPKNFFN